MYADDITVYMDGTTESLKAALEALADFYKLCGLKINLKKCKAVWIGSKANSLRKLCPEIQLDWQNYFTLLGIDFYADLTNMDNNFKKKMAEIQQIFDSWYNRFLSPYGKILVIKSLGLSKLSHIVTITYPYFNFIRFLTNP